MSLFSDARAVTRTIRGVLRRRRARRTLGVLLEQQGELPLDHFEAVLYFPDSTINLYQARQWYEPLRQLAERHPVAILARNPAAAAILIEESGLPVHHVPRITDAEQWFAQQPVGAVFYVNQNVRNFSLLRFARPAHVFLNHGESDKAYMASNQAKAYDHVFVAGQAAVDRLAERLVGYDLGRLRVVGRPQIDVTHPAPDLPDDGRTVVLYAPTWEGDRPSMEYSSIRSHAPALLEALLTTGRHRVIVRPHPRTGSYDRTYRTTLEALAHRIAAANRADPSAHHLYDDGPDYGWQTQVAQICVTDVSAVVFDALAAGLPIVLTRPASTTADFVPTGVTAAVPLLEATAAPGAAALVDRLVADPPDATVAALTAHHFGDTTPGASMARFLDAASAIITARTTR